jgi:hypothetical protein
MRWRPDYISADKIFEMEQRAAEDRLAIEKIASMK